MSLGRSRWHVLDIRRPPNSENLDHEVALEYQAAASDLTVLPSEWNMFDVGQTTPHESQADRRREDPVGTRPLGIAITPNGRRVYAVDFTSNDVSVIDITTNTVVGPGPVAFARTAAFDGNRLSERMRSRSNGYEDTLRSPRPLVR